MTRQVDRLIPKMVRSIVRRCAPEKVILFGSYASGHASPDSDVDLLVVMRTVRSKTQQASDLHVALRRYPVPKDIVVTTAAEFEWRKEIPGTIERPAAREGRVLYERR